MKNFKIHFKILQMPTNLFANIIAEGKTLRYNLIPVKTLKMDLSELLAVASKPKHFQALRDAVSGTVQKGNFAVLDDNLEIPQSSAIPANGHLIGALFQWSFYQANGYFPHESIGLYALRKFEDAIAGIWTDYLETTRQTNTLLVNLKPEVIAATVQAVPGSGEYLTGESLVSRFVNRGRIEAYPFHVEMVANAMGRLLLIKQTRGIQGLDDFRMDILAPGQTISPDLRGANVPRPGLLEAAENQHRGKLAKVPKEINLSSNDRVLSSEDWSNKVLVFTLTSGEILYIRTDLGVENFPYPHEYEPNGDRHEPNSWETIKTDKEKLTVTVTYTDGQINKYHCEPSNYCGDLIELINSKGTVREIDEMLAKKTKLSKMRVPFIILDSSNRKGHQFQVQTVPTYYDLDIPMARMGNASQMIGDLMF